MRSNWVKITKQPKSKRWITAEYSNVSKMPHRTILLYREDKKFRKKFGNWKIWIGNTTGHHYGKYLSFPTKPEAVGFLKDYLKGIKAHEKRQQGRN